MMYCKQCGSRLEPGALTCPVCGAPVPEEPVEPNVEQPAGGPEQHSASWEFGAGVTSGPATPPPPPTGDTPRYRQQPPADPVRMEQDAPEPPVKTLEWLWSLILTAIPVVNLVVLLIWSFGGGTSISKRNWARAKLILVVISTVVSVILAVIVFGIMAYSLTGHSSSAMFGYGFEPHHYYY